MTKGIDKYSIDSTDYQIGQDNIQKWGLDVHNAVFSASAGLTILFLLTMVSGCRNSQNRTRRFEE